jgi:thiosulfate reductase / polysulfide reductase chain A
MKLNLTRRDFLKRTSIAAAAFSLSDHLAPSFVSSATSGYQSNTEIIPTVCGLCRARCLVEGVVRNGRLHHIQGNIKSPFNGTKVCARGLAAVKLLYDPDRLKYPLMRSGQRGEGKWTRISWQEAITVVSSEIKRVLASRGPEGLALLAGGSSSWYIRKLFQEMKVPHIYDASWNYCDSIRNMAYESVFGDSPGDFHSLDYSNTECIVLMGSHLGENVQVPELKQFAEALGNGSQLIVVDPRYSAPANKAGYYLPIKPGTDTALILGWLNYIIENELYDETWVQENIEGFDQLKEHVSQYSLERVEAITDIPARQIRETANLIAYHAPATIIHPGGHGGWYGNDVQRLRSLAILTAVLGCWGAKGGIKPPAQRENERVSPFELPQQNTSFSLLRNKILQGDISVIGCWGQNPLQNHPLPYKTIDAFNKADFVFATDVLPTESTLYADIVFPEATFLERYDMIESWAGENQSVLASRFPVVAPHFESMDPYWIVQQLSKQIGKGRIFGHSGVEDFLNFQLRQVDSSLDKLAKNNGFIRLPELKNSDEGIDEMELERKSFPTSSGKIEISSMYFQQNGWSSIPTYEQVSKPPTGFFRLLYGRSPVHTLTQTCNNSWLNHESPENEIWVNDTVARTMELVDGEYIILENQDGIRSIKGIKVKVTPGIRQDCVYMVHGYGARSSLLSQAFNRGVSDTYLMTRSKKDPISGVRGMRTNFVRFVHSS